MGNNGSSVPFGPEERSPVSTTDKISEYLTLRGEVVHGFEPAILPADAPKFLLDFARRLQSEQPAEASS